MTGSTPGQGRTESAIVAPGHWQWMPWLANEARNLNSGSWSVSGPSLPTQRVCEAAMTILFPAPRSSTTIFPSSSRTSSTLVMPSGVAI